jgi:hypothetical protein
MERENAQLNGSANGHHMTGHTNGSDARMTTERPTWRNPLDEALREGRLSPAEWIQLRDKEIRHELAEEFGPSAVKGLPTLPCPLTVLTDQPVDAKP